MKKIFYYTLLAAVLFWSLPYLAGFLLGGSDMVFTGFLINIPDGHSYLAKMNIGWRGDWKFTLPYTAAAGDGAYIFLFYIALGHISRLMGLSLIATFHLARLISGGLMVWSLWRFCRWVFGQNWQAFARYFPLLVFGSGLGWLVSPLLGMTSDLWVAEAYPFLSGFVNPHFPLGICLILEVLMRAFTLQSNKSRMTVALLGLLLAAIMPFGMVVIGVVLAGTVVWEWIQTKRLRLEPIVFPLTLGGLYLVYQFYAIQVDPILSEWNRQNITSSPPLWDMLASFSPMFLLAIYSAWVNLRQNEELPWKVCLVWLVFGFIMIYFPFALQRRFLTAYFVPVSVLGITGLISLAGKIKLRIFIPAMVVLSILTNVLLWSSAWFGVLTRNPSVYLSQDEMEALEWLNQHAESGAVVAAGPFISMVIPARTSLRVIYGHPFETAHAERELDFINLFYAGKNEPSRDQSGLMERKARFIFWGEREAALGKPALLDALPIVFQNSHVKIFEISP